MEVAVLEPTNELTVARLRHIVDVSAIVDCIGRASQGTDRFDREIMLSAFHADAICDQGAFVGPAQELYKLASSLRETGLSWAHHHIKNHSCEIRGDVAHAESYFLIDGRSKDHSTIELLAGRYLDRLERRAGEWRIAFRYCVLEWSGAFSDTAIPTGCHSAEPSNPDDRLARSRARVHEGGASVVAPWTLDAGSLDCLRLLLDRQAIFDCMMRYTRGIDRLDRDLMLSAFNADAVVDHGGFVGSPIDLFGLSYELNGSRRMTTHLFLTNHVCEIDDDGAHAETYYLYAARTPGDKMVQLAGGRYIDRLERRGLEWKIAMRYCVVEWAAAILAREGPFANVPDIHLNGIPSHGRGDPSYRRPLVNNRPVRRGDAQGAPYPAAAS